MVIISSPSLIEHQELASPEQNGYCKDFSNPLIVDSLLKTIWSSNAPCFYNEVLASPEETAPAMAIQSKTAIGKDYSNSFMAGDISVWLIKMLTSIPTTEIFEQLALMGYHTDSDKLTFQKGAFSPQWRFLIHNILHCLSPKKTAWEQFSSNIAAAVICLATNRKFNFSRMIFEHMVSNISSPHKFLMYPRFIQLCLDMQRHKLQQHTRLYSVPSLSMKVFSNMKRSTKGFSDKAHPIVPAYPNLIPPGSKKLESQIKIGKARRQARVVLSDDEENFHPHLLNAIAGQRWLLTHGMKLLMAKCLNSTEYMEALGNAFGRAIEKGMQEGLAAGIEHGQAGRCLSDLEAYNPSAKADFNYVVRDLRGLDFSLLRELSAKKDASTWDVMDLLRLDDVMAEVLGMTDLQPDVGQLMVPVHHKQDKVVIGSQALSVALETCHRRVQKMERNLAERIPLQKDVFVSIDHPVSVEVLAILPGTSTEPLAMALITMALSTVVIRPNFDPFLLVKDYENPDLAGAVPEDVILGPEGEGKVEGSSKGDFDDMFSQLENEARDAVL
ncbi:hypothetical protein Tco_0344810 [Tanacetum coccineum]